MVSNFKISFHRNSENVHLKLAGDFDRSSAYELLDALKKYCRGASRAFIHTSCLNQIHPFGRDVLQSHLDILNGQCIPLVFTGDNADNGILGRLAGLGRAGLYKGRPQTGDQRTGGLCRRRCNE